MKVEETGKHLLLNLYNCRMPGINEIYNLLLDLSKLVNMKPLTQPYIVKGAAHDPGYTGFLIIETSHISLHSFEKRKFVAFDLYSCKDFDENLVIDRIKKLLKPKRIDKNVIRR